MSRKTLLVFCDGTGMDGLLTETNDPVFNGGSEQRPTNITRLSRAITSFRMNGNEKIPQITFYQSGTGSLAGFDGQSIAEDTSLKIYGIAVASKIRDAYCFIAQNYNPGDDICIFGFSRGAYTARKVAGLINRIGLLAREDFSKFFTYWLQLNNGEKPGPPWPSTPISIKCVGIFDTVGSVLTRSFNPIIDALSIKDTSLPSNIQIALHAVSMQENRKPFMCTLWTVPDGGLKANQILKQRWFPGAHSDVGGGYDNTELADLSLFWMASEISSFVSIDLDFVHKCRQPTPKAGWGEHQPHNAWDESGVSKWAMGHKTRLEGQQIIKTSEFHLSIGQAPTVLDDPSNMITLNDIKKAFGSGWTPTYVALTNYEQAQRDDWNKPVLGAPSGPSDLDTARGFINRTNNGQLSTDIVANQENGPASNSFWIESTLSKMVLDLSGGIHGNPVVNYQLNGRQSQKWIFEATGDNTYKIRNANTDGAYLGFPPSVTPGLGPLYADQPVSWKIEDVPGSSSIRFKIVDKPGNLTLDLKESNEANNNPILAWPGTENPNQCWRLLDVLLPYRGDIPPGTYYIRNNLTSNNALTLNVSTDEISNRRNTGNDNQKWVVEAEGYAGYRIMNYTKRDVYLSFREPGTPSDGTHAYGGPIITEWRVESAGNNVYSIIIASNPSRVLDLYYSNPDDNTPVIIWPSQSPGYNQMWSFIRV